MFTVSSMLLGSLWFCIYWVKKEQLFYNDALKKKKKKHFETQIKWSVSTKLNNILFFRSLGENKWLDFSYEKLLHLSSFVYVHEDFRYLFELDHDVFGQLHVFKHPLEFTGKRRPTFCRKSRPWILQLAASHTTTLPQTPMRVYISINNFILELHLELLLLLYYCNIKILSAVKAASIKFQNILHAQDKVNQKASFLI